MLLCRKPYTKDGAAYPCGQCMPCRFNRRREWQHRIMLESLCHTRKSFLTLTYSDGNLPLCVRSSGVRTESPPRSTLRPLDLQNWLKRLRKAIEPERVRFFAVGEYGEISERPHYHVALFGVESCQNTFTCGDARFCCDQCRLFYNTWGLGNIFAGKLQLESAGYIAGYVTKKMTSVGDKRLDGRHPEFARMSRDPGIGVPAMWDVASTMLEFGLDDVMADVPSAVRLGGKMMPYGRTLRRKLRMFIGRDANAPKETIEAVAEELRPVRESAFAASVRFADAVASLSSGRVAQLEARNAIFKKGKKL